MDFSFQLYSARNFPPVTGLFAKLKSYGYASVEGVGSSYEDTGKTAAALADAGLTMPTGHFSLDQLEDRQGTLRIAEQLGTKTLVCPFVPPEERSPDRAGWLNLAEKLDTIGTFYRDQGLKFAWHNHDFEFLPLATGELPIELLFEGAPDMLWQADIAWVHKSAQNPGKWITRFADKITSVHVKDIAPEGECMDEDGWADLGEGVLDWHGLFAAIRSQTSCKSFVMEHDNPRDVERFARRSIAAAKRLWG